jgi:hypothetical protein
LHQLVRRGFQNWRFDWDEIVIYVSVTQRQPPGKFDVQMDETILVPNEKLLKLEELVHEKDQLLCILSERLEQAVEQLDRFRREGTQPTFEEQATSLNDDSTEVKGDLRDDLRQMLDDWQGLQQRGWFDQLNQRLDSIQRLAAQGDTKSHSGFNSAAQASASVEAPAKSKVSQNDDSGDYTSSVADILKRFGKETSKEPEAPVISVVEAPAPSETMALVAGVTISERTTISERMLVPLPPHPEAVDIETADLATLKSAVAARDAYITQLEEYLQTMENTAQQQIQFPNLNELTETQRQVLDHWSESIRKEFRQTQIQISLERAQLSRETMKLQHRQHLVESEMKRLDMARRAGLLGSDDELNDGTKARGWMGLFGGK